MCKIIPDFLDDLAHLRDFRARFDLLIENLGCKRLLRALSVLPASRLLWLRLLLFGLLFSLFALLSHVDKTIRLSTSTLLPGACRFRSGLGGSLLWLGRCCSSSSAGSIFDVSAGGSVLLKAHFVVLLSPRLLPLIITCSSALALEGDFLGQLLVLFDNSFYLFIELFFLFFELSDERLQLWQGHSLEGTSFVGWLGGSPRILWLWGGLVLRLLLLLLILPSVRVLLLFLHIFASWRFKSCRL